MIILGDYIVGVQQSASQRDYKNIRLLYRFYSFEILVVRVLIFKYIYFKMYEIN